MHIYKEILHIFNNIFNTVKGTGLILQATEILIHKTPSWASSTASILTLSY